MSISEAVTWRLRFVKWIGIWQVNLEFQTERINPCKISEPKDKCDWSKKLHWDPSTQQLDALLITLRMNALRDGIPTMGLNIFSWTPIMVCFACGSPSQSKGSSAEALNSNVLVALGLWPFEEFNIVPMRCSLVSKRMSHLKSAGLPLSVHPWLLVFSCDILSPSPVSSSDVTMVQSPKTN